MRRRRGFGVFGMAVVALCAATPGVQAQGMNGPAKVAEVQRQQALTDPKGMTLYVFDEDRDGTPHCQKECAKEFPSFAAQASDGASGDWGVTNREDGSKQWVYKGRPLYTFYRDKPGEALGNAFNGNRWHIARP